MTEETSRAPRRATKRGRLVPPKVVAEARRLYEIVGLPKAEIASRLGLHRDTVRNYALRGLWSAPVPGEASVAARLRARVERELAKAERAAAGPEGASAAAADRAARTLASLMKTLRELDRYDDERARRAAAAPLGPSEGDVLGEPADLADLDAFRDELAARLDRLRREREA